MSEQPRMKLGQAVLLLAAIYDLYAAEERPRPALAASLGIEAIKRIRAIRAGESISARDPLPGEDQEET